MLHLLRRHPFPVVAHFRYSFVLTYALPRAALEPLLPPGLTLDAYGDWGFVAMAMVETERLRPAFLPRWLGQTFFLAGYRVFARYTTREGKNLRGLRILRSEADRTLMVTAGNLLTHYNYHRVDVEAHQEGERLSVRVREPRGRRATLLDVSAQVGQPAAGLPAGSPFPDWHVARRYAGPLPFTFDYEPETHSIIRIQGKREHWEPRPVAVDVRENMFFYRPDGPFAGSDVRPILASAFYVADIPYRWERGIREELPR